MPSFFSYQIQKIKSDKTVKRRFSQNKKKNHPTWHKDGFS